MHRRYFGPFLCTSCSAIFWDILHIFEMPKKWPWIEIMPQHFNEFEVRTLTWPWNFLCLDPIRWWFIPLFKNRHAAWPTFFKVSDHKRPGNVLYNWNNYILMPADSWISLSRVHCHLKDPLTCPYTDLLKGSQGTTGAEFLLFVINLLQLGLMEPQVFRNPLVTFSRLMSLYNSSSVVLWNLFRSRHIAL